MTKRDERAGGPAGGAGPGERAAAGTVPIAFVAGAVLFVAGAVNLQVPLYASYAHAAGVGNGVTGIVFAAYVLGLIPVLVFLGGISDRFGRKPVILVGVASSCLATVAVAAWPSYAVLLPARVLQGIGVGLTVGAATAYLVELLGDRGASAPRVVALATTIGFGGGPMLTGLALSFSKTPSPFSYVVVAVALVLVWAGVAATCPPLIPIGGRVVRLPLVTRQTMGPNVAIAVAWSASGVVVALVPTLLAAQGLGAWSGPVLFAAMVAGAVSQPFARRFAPGRALGFGLLLVPVGYGLLVVGGAVPNLPLVLAGACVVGAGAYGFTYLGGLSRIAQAQPHQTARAIAGFFLSAYLGFGLPSVVVGYAADQVGLAPALAGFAVALAAASALSARWSWSERTAELEPAH